ncbi:MAG: carbon-nitrogen family hydrolase [Verrucomicrobia bacterium]|nr:MAG: carbon-nitrogen family hydrolase [Verrucomicrobiota bacterium]
MRLYLCQPDIVWEDRRANLQKVRAMVESVRPAPGSLVVLPEMFSTGFSMNPAITREGIASESTELMGDLARQFQCCVMGGLVHGTRGTLFNQAVAMSPERRELVRFSKLHPFSPAGEDRLITPGAGVALFEWAGFVVAPFICYDLRFPEDFRTAVGQGATLLVVMANWPASREDHWVTLLRARAIENQAVVAGVNRCGADPQTAYPGRSMVVGPRGEILAEAGAEETVLEAEVSPDLVRESREAFPALRDAGLIGSPAEVFRPRIW